MNLSDEPITITIKEFAIAEYYYANLNKCKVRELRVIFNTGDDKINKALEKYRKLKRVNNYEVPVEEIKWDPNELEGELNPDHDFMKLIKIE